MRIEIHHYHHFPGGVPGSPEIARLLAQLHDGQQSILAAIQKQGQTIMSALTDLATQEDADTKTLIGDIDQIVANQAQAISDAVQKALADANADQATATSVMTATDQAIKDEAAKLDAILHPAPAPDAPVADPNAPTG